MKIRELRLEDAKKIITRDFNNNKNGYLTEFEYKCPEDGQLMMIEDNTEKIKKIEQDIVVLEKLLSKE